MSQLNEYWNGIDIIDTDKKFTIDPLTREIKYDGEKRVLIQNDHNSERFTFEIPRFIEGRDVAKCNVVQVYYINVKNKSSENSTGVYTVDDMEVYPFINDTLKFTWLISQNATRYYGKLSFMVRFANIDDEGNVSYAWSSDVYDDIDVVESLDSDISHENQYVDVIQQWKNDVMSELRLRVDNAVQNNIDVAQIRANEAGIVGLNVKLTDSISALEADMATHKARMDAFTKLGEGSTTGDAELADARTSIDGNTYANVGTAIRKQFEIDRKRSAYASVFTNGTPVVDFIPQTSVSLYVPNTTHIFFNGKRYDVTELTAGYTILNNEVEQLFIVLFNTETNEVSIKYSGAGFGYPFVQIGVICLNRVYFNNWVFSESTNFQPMSNTPSLVTSFIERPPYFTIEGTTITLKIPTAWMFYYDRHNYNISAREVVFENIDTSFIIFYILYDKNTDSLSLLRHGEEIPNGMIALGLLHRNMGIIPFGHGHKNHLVKTPATMIMGAGQKYVEFDSINKMIKIPNDTLLIPNGSQHFIQLADTKGNTTISYADKVSTALCLYVNIVTEELVILQYSDIVPDSYALICSFRTNIGSVSINAPYTWDGRPFRLSAEDLDMASPKEVDLKQNFNVKSINHRGYCVGAPENTLSAYKLSAKNKFEYVECDVAFTSDDIPVLLHDGTIDRTSDGTGNIGDLTFEQVRAYDFGSWYNEKYTGEKIPSLDEFILLCKNLGLHPYIEIKSSAAYTEDQIKTIIATVNTCGMKGKISYISFNHEYLTYVKDYDPEARIGYVVNSIDDNIINTAKTLQTGSNEVFIDAAYGALTVDGVLLCINSDIPLEVWTINSTDALNTTMANFPYISGVSSDGIHAGRSLYESNC